MINPKVSNSIFETLIHQNGPRSPVSGRFSIRFNFPDIKSKYAKLSASNLKALNQQVKDKDRNQEVDRKLMQVINEQESSSVNEGSSFRDLEARRPQIRKIKTYRIRTKS